MAEEVSYIQFNEEPTDGIERYKTMKEAARTWTNANTDSMEIVGVTDGVHLDEDLWDDGKIIYKHHIVVSYTGEAEYENPQTCDHSSFETTVITDPTCETDGLERTICNSCKSILQSVTLPAFGHSWVSNEDGTHTCSNCGDTVACDCSGINVPCSYCGYIAYPGITVTFDPNGGTCDVESIAVAIGSTIGELPIATMEGFIFGGWFTAAVGGIQIDSSYTPTVDTTFYARWADENSENVDFSDATTTFNLTYDGDRTNYNNQDYTIYGYQSGNSSTQTSDLTYYTGFWAEDMTSGLGENNKQMIMYLKVSNSSDEAKTYDIGFDCDSYVNGSDSVVLTRIENGLSLGTGDSVYYTVTAPYNVTVWVGKYSSRTANRFTDCEIGYSYGDNASGTGGTYDSGYAFTMHDIYIGAGSYVILAITFTIPD